MAAIRALLGLCALLAIAAPVLASRELLQKVTEADVLNFALNLEYLEATFYKCALDGKPLPANLRGGGPTPKGCKKAAKLDTESKYLLAQLAKDEIAHVAFLRAALGKGAVPSPLIDVGPAFVAAANAAANATLKPPFSPYTNALYFLHGAFIFEDVGVTAYHGGLRALKTDAYRAAAEGIRGVEAYHAGAVRLALYNQKSADTGYGVNVETLIKLIADLRDAADGTEETEDAGLEDLAPADENGVAHIRDVNAVLRIVYLGGTSKGGFFPNGMNGVIKTAA